jgi:hypothetical protein
VIALTLLAAGLLVAGLEEGNATVSPVTTDHELSMEEYPQSAQFLLRASNLPLTQIYRLQYTLLSPPPILDYAQVWDLGTSTPANFTPGSSLVEEYFQGELRPLWTLALQPRPSSGEVNGSITFGVPPGTLLVVLLAITPSDQYNVSTAPPVNLTISSSNPGGFYVLVGLASIAVVGGVVVWRWGRELAPHPRRRTPEREPESATESERGGGEAP